MSLFEHYSGLAPTVGVAGRTKANFPAPVQAIPVSKHQVSRGCEKLQDKMCSGYCVSHSEVQRESGVFFGPAASTIYTVYMKLLY